MGSIDTLSNRHGRLVASNFPYQLSEKDYVGDISQSLEAPKEALPDGFPSQVKSSMTWTAAELEGSKGEWIIQLTPDEARAIEEAVSAFIESKTPIQQIGQETFPLPQSLTDRLDQISEICHNSLGFCILRGLQASKRSEEAKAVLFAGVSSHIASKRGFQDIDRKHVLTHLFKRYARVPNEYIPPTFNNSPVAFHTDDGDIVALYYASLVEQGGRTQLASQSKVYNELATKRPDLVEVLADKWFIDTYYASLDTPARQLPLLHRHGQEGITIQYSRLPFSCYDGSRPRKPDIPALTDLQKEVLNSLQTIAVKHVFPVPTQPGDILYFNNVGLFHGRERYVDSGKSDTLPEDMDRHVLRLWLQDPKRTEPLAPPLQKIWDEIYGPNTDNGRDEIWNAKAIAAFVMNADKNG